MQTKVLAGLVAIIVVAGGFYIWNNKAQAPAGEKRAMHWTFTDAGENTAGNPQTKVSLNDRVIGTYEGSCSEIDGSGWTLLAGEVSGVICWFAGGGKEVGVFALESGDGYEVMEGDLDEGSAEVAGTRGNFKILFTI